MTVVSIYACYTNPYTTDTITIAPGQTMDVLLKADQPLGSYYMAASVYQGSDFVTFDDTAIIEYDGAATTTTPIMPVLPDFSDNETAHRFLTNLIALTSAPFWEPVPQPVDERLLITIGISVLPCDRPNINQCQGINNTIVAASMNNISFNPSTNLSILEAYYYNVDGIYTTDFPDKPPIQFDYTSPNNQLNGALLTTSRGAKEYSTQQGIYESYYRDEMVVFGKWEFDPLDLENIFDDKDGSFHIWQGGMDEGIPIPLVHYVVQKLPWIHYHEVPNATHAIALDNHIKYQMLKELVTYQNGIASSTNNYI
ncbi:oxidase [Lithospermum erythrorhizon]|uniref:Oxidase n=1 Tax=Lithospermum erythrorhizon TaxID=34254 RepID=A0AAV3Q6Z1_LITER